nr:hypothetical protein [Tanacetum cinerariifolium]
SGLVPGIIPEGNLGISICRGIVLGTSLPDALHADESSPEFGNASGSGGCEDDEMAKDEEGG